VGWQPGGKPGSGGVPDPGPDLPGEHERPPGLRWALSHAFPQQSGAGDGTPRRDRRLAGFAKGGEWDTSKPSAALAAALEGASGPERRCAGASRDEMIGLLRHWAAMEAWAAAGRLGVLRALIRDDAQPLPSGGSHGDLPDGWTKSLTHEAAAALAVSVPTAENMVWLAWDLEARLPGIAGLLADGTLTYSKARAVDETFQLLSEEQAARAEALIMPELPGKNYGQVKKLAEQAAITVDPDSATRRREHAEREKSRVQMFREVSGAAALSGRDLPTAETLAAHAGVCARAQEYLESGAFPDIRMDQYRVAAYLDLLMSINAEERIALGWLPGIGADVDADTDVREPNDGKPGDDGKPEGKGPGGGTSEDDNLHDGTPDGEADDGTPDDGTPDNGEADNGEADNGEADNGEADGGEPGGGAPDDGGPNGGPGHRGPRSGGPEARPRLTDLVIPLATLLGLAERPGEGHGLGPLDPDLCRALAALAVRSPHSTVCVTVTDREGIAIGHGCARLAKKQQSGLVNRIARAPISSDDTLTALPARANLTIPAARLTELARSGAPPGRAPWSFARNRDQDRDQDQASDPGPSGGFGRWILTLPDGRDLDLDLGPVPTYTCDHRHESHAYQPNDKLRHLVQIRDGECTFPPCSRHARETDFEHAVPYDKGGRTCACNAGARSRQCHRVKQSPGWNVTQPKPGWHQWETPAGRVYTQGPKRYPA
jgi:hypothetical protein